MSDKGENQTSIPSWDGSAKTWRKYTREVAWWVQSVPTHKRRYCATKLVSKLSGSARLLAMSWPLAMFDHPDGTRDLIKQLASSPLVRQTLPNAAAICSQYFSFRRHQNESMGSFLTRETLGFAEFTEALERLYDEKNGVAQADKDFGIPSGTYRDETEYDMWGWSWYNDDDENEEQDVPVSPHQASHETAAQTPPSATGQSPARSLGRRSRRSAGVSVQSFEGHGGLSMTDSFIMGVLRGWRLLQAAGLNHEEKRDILATSQNRMDYESISRALMTLWDDQLLGRQHGQHGHLHVQESHEDFAAPGDWVDSQWGESWWEDEWQHGYWAEHESQYDWDQAWHDTNAHVQDEPKDPEIEAKLHEAQQAERLAEQMAAEATRTWSEAKKATAALHRDRGFGAVKGKGSNNKCFICGGDHFARSCPDNRHGPHPKLGGKGKGIYNMDPYYDDYYQSKGFKGKKGKFKKPMGGKSNYLGETENENMFMRHNGKGKWGSSSSMSQKAPVNVYSQEYFGLDMELQQQQGAELPAISPSTLGDHEGMIDCGATASAAPETSVKGLIQALLAQDRSATIEIDSSARPYFRYGNGKWGRALYQVHLSSSVSGNVRTFSIFALPNPPDLHQPWFDRSMLVPILIGMDHMGPNGAAMMIDFTTGMCLNTKDEDPKPYQLRKNHKGHYVLDIREFLTGGCINSHGHMHIHVRHGQNRTNVAETGVLEFHPVCFEDMVMHPVQPVLTHDTSEGIVMHSVQPAFTHTSPEDSVVHHVQRVFTTATLTSGDHDHDFERTLRLMRLLQSASTQVSMRSQPSTASDNSKIPTASHAASCNAIMQPRRSGDDRKHQGLDTKEGTPSGLRPRPEAGMGSQGSEGSAEPMALFRPACGGLDDVQPTCAVATLQALQPSHPLCAEDRQSGEPYAEPPPRHGAQDVGPAGSLDGGQEAYIGDLSCNDGKDQCRGEASCEDQLGDQAVYAQVESQKECQDPCRGGGDPDCRLLHEEQLERQLGEHQGFASRPIVSRGGRTSDRRGARRVDAHNSPTEDAGGGQHGVRGEPGTTLKRLPLHIGNKLLTFMTLMTTTLTMSSASMVLDGRDFLWEVACSENSWLTSEALRQGLPARRINYSSGYDIYKPETWQRLRELQRVRRPRKIWLSLPCTKWCRFANLNYATPERREVLETARRKERRMLKEAKDFLLDAVDYDPTVDIYFEWTHPCSGWEQKPMLDLRDGLLQREYDWLPCRIDGCCYGMMNRDNTMFLQKKWLIRTTDPRFHRLFRAKCCPGNHAHARIEGAETSRTAYYPLRMVVSIMRHWMRELVPLRHLHLLSACADVHDNEFAYEDENWVRRAHPISDPMKLSAVDGFQEFSCGQPDSEVSQPLALLPDSVGQQRSKGDLSTELSQHQCEFHVHVFAGEAESPDPDAIVPEPEVTQAERDRWQAKLFKFHRAAGHPTNRNLVNLFRDAQLPRWKIDMAHALDCPACKSLKLGGSSSGLVAPAATHRLYTAWEAVGVDVSEWIVPNANVKLKFMLLIDLATRLRAVHIIKTFKALEMKSESSADVIKGISERWLMDKPKPSVIIPDNGSTLVSRDVASFLADIGVQMTPPAEKESWAHGQIESAIKDLKMTASAIQVGNPTQDPWITLQLAAAALNSTEYVKGFSSFQWCYGKNYSITDEEVRTFASLPELPGDDYARLVRRRQDAEEVARKTRALRVMSKLQNSVVRQPIRTFHPMQLVMVWRKMWPSHIYAGKRHGMRKSVKPHWIGPGRVIFHEVLNHQHHEDHRRHIVWVLMHNQLLRCSVHSVRPTTSLEQTEYEVNNKEDVSRWRSLSDVLPNREYIDLADSEPHPEEREEPDLPDVPDETTVSVPVRRLRGKNKLGPEDWRDVPKASASSMPAPMPIEAPMGNDDDVAPTTPYSPSIGESEPELIPDDPGAPPDDAPINEYESESKKPRDMDYDLKWIERLQEPEADLHACFMDCSDVMTIEFDLMLSSHRQLKDFIRDPSAFMVKKMRDSEVVLSKLSKEHKELFARAKRKEVNSFVKAQAVRKALDEKELREAFGSNRIMRARWVLTWKLTPPEDLASAREEAKSSPATTTYTKEGDKKAKARIVLLGYEHPDLLRPEFRTASPVCSTLGRNLLYTLTCVHGWEMQGLDLATAFLQTQPTAADQDLWTRGVSELREAIGVSHDSIMKVLKNVYGSTTAPRGLWLDLHRRLASIGGRALVGERCIWIWISESEKDDQGLPKILGAMGGHVDDFHRSGNQYSSEWRAICAKIDKLYEWGTIKEKQYRHAGTDVQVTHQNNSTSITVNQDYYVEMVSDIGIEPDRLRREDAMLTVNEIAACRATLGHLQWLAVQTQPQLSARCNLLTSELASKKNMAVARELQQMVGEIRKESFKLHFKKPDKVKSWRDVVFVTFCDQAHTNRPNLDSTGGIFSVASGPDATEGRVAYMAPLAWRCWKLRRKAISSNDAEVQAVLEGEDQNFRIRTLWCELNGCVFDKQAHVCREWTIQGEELARKIKGIVATDSRGGYDAVLLNESPMLGLSNTRSALQALQVRESLLRAATELRWVASDYDLGDALTKKKQESRVGLVKFLRTGLWSVAFDPTFTSARKSHEQGQSAVKVVDQQLKKGFLSMQFHDMQELFEHDIQLDSHMSLVDPWTFASGAP